MITSHEQAQSRMGVSSCVFPAFKFLSVEHGRLFVFQHWSTPYHWFVFARKNDNFWMMFEVLRDTNIAMEITIFNR